MTGRTCPIHGEYSATGACRWCEPPRQLTAFTWEDGARVCNVDETTLKSGPSIFDTMVEGWVRIVRARLQDDMVEARYLTFDATECSQRLLAQHAALRWERVARRWAAKGPTPPGHRMTVVGSLAFDDHCAECRRQRRLIAAGISREWP